jgi:hypothetical protein
MTEDIGDIQITKKYWDCDCLTNYIHPDYVTCCGRCGALKEDQPDSRVKEVEKVGFKIKDYSK